MTDTATTLDATFIPESEERIDPAWAGVGSLALGVFGLVTAEFLPVSILTPMAADLGISTGTAGQAVTATAVVGAVAGLTIAIATRRFDRRLVLWGFTLALIASSLLAAFATNLAMLLAARVVLGIGLGGFWSMMAAIALRLVPMSLVPRAMSIVFTGVSVATVCAAPIGAYIGDLWGWRAAFLMAAAVGAVTLIVQMATIPRLPPQSAPSLKLLLDLMRMPSIRIGIITVLLFVSGHFAGFTYVRPFLENVPEFGIEAISLILLAYGTGGFFGNLAGGLIIERSITAAVSIGTLLIAAMAFALVTFGSFDVVSAVAVTLWGFAFGALPVAVQTWMVRAAPDHAESTGGLIVATFQVGIASGAVLGGLFVDSFGPLGAITYCAVATLASGLYVVASRRSIEV
ncbi:putative MFS family arabinose efflux permease [Sinorhizobium meliloti]|uniref:MFS transporter n=1 Tax=Rhizobium meliloti TaxID=382 RepID=UPI000FD7EDB9|nr:MFS transporter [Sinorhizobium meliloti]MDE3813453.1 MFS transporter [Sinorhizobium meliloti]RVH30056.1 MFS transporter [Sinorhizobium meliloti]